MSRRILAAAVLLVAPLALAAAGTTRRAWVAPAGAAERKNPLESQPDLVAGGRKVYALRCANCHGDDLGGTKRAPALTDAHVRKRSDGELFWKITSGNTRSGMPTFSNLPEPQRWQLVLLLRAGTEHASE